MPAPRFIDFDEALRLASTVDAAVCGQNGAMHQAAAPASADSANEKARNLVVCCDGTNNTLTGGVQDTNVLLLHGYLRKHADPAATLLYYDPGVGTPDAAPPTGLVDLLKRRADRIAGLASGRGVYENIGEAYRFLMQNWGPGDRIFCFGFSRGAFTARAVVGMVNLFGVLEREHEPLIPTLVRIYFSQPPEAEQVHGRKNWRRALGRFLHVGMARPGKAAAEATQPAEEETHVTRNELADEVRRNFSRPAAVHWVGVWDTVESVGPPLLGSRDNPSTATFHDKPKIHHVRHALALDEHRWPFVPRLYDAASDFDREGRTLKQLWFPGVHCDVGGSYAATRPGSVYPDQRTGLSDLSLQWMVNEVAAELGVPPLASLPSDGKLPYDDLGMPRQRRFPATLPLRHDPLHDTPYWTLAGMTLREMRTQIVMTNAEAAQAAAERKRGVEPQARGIAVDVRARDDGDADGPSVWDERRKLWPALAAAVVAVLAMILSGWNLLAPADLDTGRASWRDGPAAACSFAMQQLATVSPWPVDIRRVRPDCEVAPPGGLRNAAVADRYRAASPAWAMAWDFVFIAAFGYLIARLASRVFTWLAGWRRPGQPRSRWLLALGWLPALAVGADALENTATLAALALPFLGMPSVGTLALFVVGAFSLIKLAGYALCLVVFGVGRLVLAVLPGSQVGKVGRQASLTPPAR